MPTPRTPFLQVRLEGEDITPWISSVTVTEDDRQADSASITIPDPRMIYADALIEGSVAEIDLGYAEPDQHALVLRAIVTKVEQSYPDSGVPAVTLKGEDRSILMGLQERRQVYRDTTVTGVVQQVAQRYEFSRVEARLDPDPRVRTPIVQDAKTDLAFLQELGETYHAKSFVELDAQGREVLYFLPERRIVTLRRPERLVLRYRAGPDGNLQAFSPAFDASYIDRLKEVTDVDAGGRTVRSQEREPADVAVWDLDPGARARASAADWARIQALYQRGVERKQDLQRQLSARRPTVAEVVVDQDELDARTDSLEAHRLGMTATGSTFGNIWLRAKSNVRIEGVHERFKGEWYVSSVTHKSDGSKFTTDFKCVR